MTITYKNLMWLKNTPLKNFVSLMEAVTQDMTETCKEQFLDDLWRDVTLMRHMNEKSYKCDLVR